MATERRAHGRREMQMSQSKSAWTASRCLGLVPVPVPFGLAVLAIAAAIVPVPMTVPMLRFVTGIVALSSFVPSYCILSAMA